jgi:hypothetical protein
VLSTVRAFQHKVGIGLYRFVLQKYTDGADLETASQPVLTAICEKLTDTGRGIDRLRRAASAIGDARYSEICREFNLPSDSPGDIPDRDALQRLLACVEAEAARQNGPGQGTPPGRLAEARGRLLRAARQMADKTGRRLADIIAETSNGELSLDRLRDLTDAEAPAVSIARITR